MKKVALVRSTFRTPAPGHGINMDPIYLDYAATTPVRPEVRDAMLPLLTENFGNASSIHRWGREAKARLEEARARLAATIGAHPGEIVFTRGGTESDNLAILGRARRAIGRPVVCSAIEHRAVLMAAKAAAGENGARARHLPVDSSGVVDFGACVEAIGEGPAVISVMWANNELGTIQPIGRIAEACSEAGIALHTDAVQAFGKLEIQVDRVPVDLLSISAHKIGGPKGVGALYIRKGTEVAPLIHGGGHERGLRAGTEDVAGAVGFAVAAELAIAERTEQMSRLERLRDRLQSALEERVPDLVVNGREAPRIATILNVSAPGASNEVLLMMLDLEGMAVSSGSACSSGGVEPSHVLLATGAAPEIAGPSVRFSLGRQTTSDEIERVIQAFPPLMQRLREMAAV